MGHSGRGLLAVAFLSAALVAMPSALVSPALATTGQSPTITLRAAHPHLHVGKVDTLTGTVTNAPAGSQVKLFSRPFPYKKAHLLGTVAPGPSGGFSFAVKPDRNTRYGVMLTETLARAITTIGVVWPLGLKVSALPLGRAAIRIVVHHPSDLNWRGARARWYFKTSANSPFREAHSTRTHHLNKTAIELHTVATLPAGRFRWRVCFYAPAAHALVNLKRPPGCKGRGYYGHGWLPAGYPKPAAVSRAASYEAHRAGRTSFAVMDSERRLSGRNIHWRYRSASVVKAMLLVAYLRLKQARGEHRITQYDRSILNPMIQVSDNNAATRCWQIVGDRRLYALAHAAHMTDFSIVGIWANAEISAADQARYFFEMDSLIPHEFIDYARYLLSHIASYESWGIPAVARPRGYQVFFKGGWIPPYLVHQAARLEGHGKRFAIAVMTDSDPSFSYGIGTIQGVASTLLGG